MSKSVTAIGTPGTLAAGVEAEALFDEVERLSDQIEGRAYELFEERGRNDGHAIDDWLRAEGELLTPVTVEILQTDETITVRAEAPGFSAEDILVNVAPMRCVIASRIQMDQRKSRRGRSSERRQKRICRLVQLPEEVLPDESVFDIQDGLIKLTLRRAHR